HPARVPSLRNSASHAVARGSERLALNPECGLDRRETGRRWVDVLRRRPELVSAVNRAGLAFLTEFSERGLNLHPDLHVLGLDVDQLRREPDPHVHLDDRHDVRLLHLELRWRVVNHRVGDDAPLALEMDPLHLANGSATARRAHGPRREVDLAAASALRADQVVAALNLPPEPRDG